MADLSAKTPKTCPKCSTNLARVDYYTKGGLSIGLGFFSSCEPQLYLCTACGFTEFWVDNKEQLRKIREKLSR